MSLTEVTMKSITKLYRIGTGPSSSHTMGPQRAAEIFKGRFPGAERYQVVLFGSLAATGKGHLTDVAIKAVFQENIEIIWKPEVTLIEHPNAMTFTALDPSGKSMGSSVFFSTGGGAIREQGEDPNHPDIYPIRSLDEIITYCHSNHIRFFDYVYSLEDESFSSHLEQVWTAMKEAIDRGIRRDDILPGELKLKRKAWTMYRHAGRAGYHLSKTGQLAAYALAVSEENAGGGVIVTAPTCGSCGVLPAVLNYMQEVTGCSDTVIYDALATAGLIGNLIKHNASISGAEAGCQAEIGAACAMAAAAATQISGGSLEQIEYAAEMGMEHHLGLTCDPVCGLVQIPCIERNAFAATRSITCSDFALATDGTHHISFDDVVKVMMETGTNMPVLYKETSTGGLATTYKKKQ